MCLVANQARTSVFFSPGRPWLRPWMSPPLTPSLDARGPRWAAVQALTHRSVLYAAERAHHVEWRNIRRYFLDDPVATDAGPD